MTPLAPAVSALVLFLLALPGAGSGATSGVGCPVAAPLSPVGSVNRVYRIPRGCAWLTIPQPEPSIPILRVRQRDVHGHWFTRSFPLPREQVLRPDEGACADETGVFVVSYPFVTVAAGGGHLEGTDPRLYCNSAFDGMLVWIGELSRTSRPTVTWRTG